jgi:hypothetical protein
MTPMPMPRWMRAPLAVAAAAALLLPTAAAAHEGHTALPPGFEAQTLQIADAKGAKTSLDGVSFTVAPTGDSVTATNTSDAVLEVSGEQAGEPLVRVSASDAEVNESSPQAVGIEGAAVDPEAAAELLDLLYKRAESHWVPLARGGSVTFMDHRAVPGHPPIRAEHELGDVIHEWKVPFTYDGTTYALLGNVTAVEAPATFPWIPVAIAVALVGAGLVVWFLRRRTRRQPAPAAEAAAPRARVTVP